MFKNVDGWESLAALPGLRERVAAALPILADELKDSADRISLRWGLRPAAAGGWDVELEMADDWFGQSTGRLNPATFDRSERHLRQDIRELHGRILSNYLDGRVKEYKKRLAEPVEA